MIQKCQILRNHPRLPHNLFILHDQPIPSTVTVRDLGLNYSCLFNFSEHVALQVAKAKRMTSLILRSFHIQTSRCILFKFFVRPLLEYCSLISSFLRKCDTIEIEKVQRSFTRRALDQDLSYKQRCLILNLQPLWLRRILLNLTFLFRLIYNQAHSSGGPLKFKDSEQYNLRNNQFTFYINPCRTVLRHKFFLPKTMSLWNRLPIEIRRCSSLKRFRRQLYQFLTPEAFHSLLNLTCLTDTLYEQGISNY